ncbi:carbon-nitrogen hydrolase family protein [Roseibaca sp. Y0-43]|uniref:carbon-nitrogen hydrolase family protein n=1 Tax=Roseibaca sp. Y0-43 TaxID=2816854 RepID=UPI001D0CB052|nr:carbon-nitrogen hydrolase family protein [Roseibaca sp. Y0-43]MCC1481785.1 carbon-nitrogen hydrolase family protein [Roseibaca sp. Y0-43]
MTFRAALLQLNSGDTPADNLPITLDYLREAHAQGAQMAFTPEVTNCISTSRAAQAAVLCDEASDPTLAAIRALAAELGLWVHIGSLALKTGDADGRFANRAFVIGPDGAIMARYDKIHMFDVQVSETETYRESAAFRPGGQAVLADTPFARFGLSICYDLRFPALYRSLAKAGAQIFCIPAAFSPVTGAAHWLSLLRARAIENGAFVLAPAQTGLHKASAGRERRTHGHGMVIAPWGEVLLDMGRDPGVALVEIDLARVADARARVPSLEHDRPFLPPDAP